MSKISKQYVTMKVSNLIPYENNKKHWLNVDQIVKSIQANSYVSPIVIWKWNVIIAGHGRKLALDKLWVEECDVIKVEWLTEEQERDLRLRDNKLWELSVRDFDAIKLELEELNSEELDELFPTITAEPIDYEWELEWMPEFNHEDMTSWKKVIVHFKTKEDLFEFAEVIGQKMTEKTPSIWYPEQESISRTDKLYINEENND